MERPFEAAFAGWIVVAVVFWLALMRLLELLSPVAFGVVWAAVYLGAPLVLLLWAISRAIRRRGPWLFVPAVLFAAVVVLASGIFLVQVSAYLNFLAHKTAFDAVVADAKAGRLDRAGSRHGVRYILPFERPDAVVFPWNHDTHGGWIGVAYDEDDCPPKPPPRPEPTKAGEPPMIKNAGRMDERWRISGHYCFSVFRGM
jgi:hypothetical protein